MTDREAIWEMIGECQQTRENCEKCREKIKDKDYEIILRADDFEYNLEDIISQEEHNAISEIIDSLLLGEIYRNKAEEFRHWEKLRNE